MMAAPSAGPINVARPPSATMNHFCIHAIVQQANQIIIARQRADQLGLRDNVSRVGIQLDFGDLTKSGESFFRDRLGDKDFCGHCLIIRGPDQATKILPPTGRNEKRR